MGKKPKEVMTGRHAAFIITRAAKAFLLKRRVSKMLLDGLNKKKLPQISQKTPNNLPSLKLDKIGGNNKPSKNARKIKGYKIK